jgi:hypothetical protein
MNLNYLVKVDENNENKIKLCHELNFFLNYI